MHTWTTAIGIFTTRELAITVWLGILLLFILYKKDVRHHFYILIKTALRPILLKIWISLAIYVSSIVFILYEIKFWNISLLKDSIIWTLWSVTCLFAVLNSKCIDTWLNNYIKSNISGLIFIEFISSAYTFNIIIELIIFPLSALLLMIISYTKNSQLNKILNKILLSLGLLIITYSIINIAMNLNEFATVDNFHSFSIAPILTTLLIPYLVTMSTFSHYERIFSIIPIAIKNPKLRQYAKHQAIWNFKFNTNLVERWKSLIVTRNPNTKKDISNSIQDIIKIHLIEKNPPTVPQKQGWQHTKACKFMTNHKFTMNAYKNYFKDEWCASSDYMELNTNTLPDLVTYYVYGNQLAATQLKLNLDVQNNKSRKTSDVFFANYCNHLSITAVNTPLSNEIKKSILSHTNYESDYGYYKISVENYNFISNTSYEIKFIIKIIHS